MLFERHYPPLSQLLIFFRVFLFQARMMNMAFRINPLESFGEIVLGHVISILIGTVDIDELLATAVFLFHQLQPFQFCFLFAQNDVLQGLR